MEKNSKKDLKSDKIPYSFLAFIDKRYCSLCNLEQPLRSKHCKICKCCIYLYDHHCPWLGNCIGEKNK